MKLRNLDRFGVIMLSLSLEAEDVHTLFGCLNFIPTQVDHDWQANSFRFFGYSPYFEPVTQPMMATVPPEYRVGVTMCQDETLDETYLERFTLTHPDGEEIVVPGHRPAAVALADQLAEAAADKLAEAAAERGLVPDKQTMVDEFTRILMEKST